MDQQQTDSAAVQALEIFDPEEALASAGDDAELLAELLDIFLQDLPRMVDEVAHAVASRDADALQRSAHALKGSVAVLAAHRVTALAYSLEQLGRAAQLADAPHTFSQLELEVERLVARLEEFRSG